jgi:outer membrane protein OmpA-like peptidoglycan-associated protein
VFTATIATLLVAAPGFAADGDKSNIKGMITGVNGNIVTLKDANNATQTITLSPTTKVKSRTGLGVAFKTVEQSALMPGLPISADVVAAGGGFNATSVDFKASDFKTAQQVQAGLAPTDAQVAANKARLNDFGTNETLATADVLFASGSTVISAQGKSDLMAFATKAKATKGYQVTAMGYTDSTGNAAANQALSKARATAVVNFLQQKGGLSTARVHSSDGMGVATDAGTGNNANARKVTARLFVDKGVNDGNN